MSEKTDQREEIRLCRHMHVDGVKLCIRYTLSDGKYIGEIDMTCVGGHEAQQMLAYDLLQVTSAWVQGDAVPETGAEPVMQGRA